MAWGGVGSNPAGDINNCLFEFFNPSLFRTAQNNEIKHDHSPLVIVVLVPIYDIKQGLAYL